MQAGGRLLSAGTLGKCIASPVDHLAAPSLYPKLPYDSIKDFTPVGLIASVPMVLVVGPSSPAKSVQELLAMARAKNGAMTMASAGSGSGNHIVGELFQEAAGVKFVHVPYKGSAPANTDVAIASARRCLFFTWPPRCVAGGTDQPDLSGTGDPHEVPAEVVLSRMVCGIDPLDRGKCRLDLGLQSHLILRGFGDIRAHREPQRSRFRVGRIGDDVSKIVARRDPVDETLSDT